jgi:uncharacterized protein (DUF2126 family)
MLAEAGIVLTQGGEPTFIPEDHSAPEWNLEALGEEKLRLAWNLCHELRQTLMPGALILRSNGKQYPGEPIPRWKLMLLRGSGGAPLWKDTSLLLDGERAQGANKKPITPRKFLSALAVDLGVTGGLRPVYEDIEAAMHNEMLCGRPAPLPRYSRLRKKFVQPRWSTEDRKRWQGMHASAGWALPLDRVEEGWITANWRLPDGSDLLLLPGTSTIGLRLPLHRLKPGTLSCAMTAEIQHGALTLFLPPLPDAESFAELVAAIERTAALLGSPPIAIEGYPPPYAEGWESLAVIPDPGVIEVNLPPAPTWGSLEKTTIALFKAAASVGLRGARTLPSGDVVPTGGGGHLVLGGTALEANPFLHKPWLLPSFLRFIQRHPSLSYLFSGRFMGPSSQAPRIDESFFEVPYELEIALSAIESMESPADPAMIDAILRNLLLDLHGNTHKAEVSIDKFFNPFMPNGRLGLVEFRAIEMSPDIASFLAIQALWRALAAAFAVQPYSDPLIDWKEKLHGHYLLPSHLEHDLGEVLAFLNECGFAFDPAWFGAHLEFRFPVLAKEELGEGHLILRRAVEPWPLLGEQPTAAGGLIRCVDSSTERLEIYLRDLPENTEVTVNGHQLRLWPHPSDGLLGAVRFRTRRLPTSLHPQVAPHTPLEIGIHDGNGKAHGLWHYHPEGSDARKRVTRVQVKENHAKRQSGKASRSSTLDLRAVTPPGS